MNIYEIPLTPDPQRFTVTLSGVDYRMTVQYRDAVNGGWVLDIGDANDEPIVNGIPMVTGVNLLEQYGYLGFTGGLWVQTTDDPDAVPTFENLGIGAHVYWVTS
ncbi:phage baseplate plug family protein [Chitiniphilus eburneus]|uniref:Cyanophage baseplate Pam3 plug gp18 domain-containing protein n=1 Tax=Chitiniphilus eburneus TaxID=2571148 RepID=A0A4U0Q3D8_9NEIS|nr:hypothetical protein [Chitiniphilus eburneus]TJZ75577.1 hypothetical protein FAZ21_06580 [Chitiniphilus eburneus]